MRDKVVCERQSCVCVTKWCVTKLCVTQMVCVKDGYKRVCV